MNLDPGYVMVQIRVVRGLVGGSVVQSSPLQKQSVIDAQTRFEYTGT